MSTTTSEESPADLSALDSQAIEAPSMELKIASWLIEQAKAKGIFRLELRISSYESEGNRMRVSARAPSKPDSFYADEAGYGKTIEEAVRELRAKIDPLRIADQSRKKAKELLAEAQKLEAQAAAMSPAESPAS